MIGLKRFIRNGLAISAIGHVGILAVGLLYFRASSQEAVPPDAMVVDIVPPDEAPRLSGTPSDLRSSGSEQASNSASAAAQPPPPQPKAPKPEQPQQRSNPQRDTHPAMAQPPTAQAEMASADKAQPEMASSEKSEPTPDAPQQPPEEAPDQPNPAEMMARLALVGGPLGGGFDAPPINALQAAYDFTVAFREHVSSCSALPPGIGSTERIKVSLRVFLNRDGTLAQPPQLLDPFATEKQLALMQSSISALQKCQPYTMLPADKYKLWKKLDLVFYPLNFVGR
jgi:hypothetical protein